MRSADALWTTDAASSGLLLALADWASTLASEPRHKRRATEPCRFACAPGGLAMRLAAAAHERLRGTRIGVTAAARIAARRTVAGRSHGAVAPS